MKFCSHCGTQIDDAASFCPGCGKQSDSQVIVKQSVPISATQDSTVIQRQNTILSIGNVYGYFLKKKDTYNEYDSINEQIAILANSPGKGLLITGIVMASIGMFIFTLYSGNISSPIGFLRALLVSAIWFIPLIIYLFKKKKNSAGIEKLQGRLCVLANELTGYYNAYGYCPIGPEYSNPAIIEAMMRTIRAGRADTIKEAINVLLDDAHKSAVELAAVQTANAARTAAAGATASAIFNAASFFF